MSKTYVPDSLSEYLGESKSITLKRKYGERPTITAGTQAPLRNQVLSFVAENVSVSKLDLKRFIVGLKEGGSTPAAANMFIKRNARFFITESKNGITYFKLSNLGQRLVSKYSQPSPIISESKSNPLNKRFRKLNENSPFPIDGEEPAAVEFEDDRFGENIPFDSEIDDAEGEQPEMEPEMEEPKEMEEPEKEDENFDYYEDDEKIVLTYYKTGEEESEEETEPEETDELGEEDLEGLEEGEVPEDEDEEDDDFSAEGASRPHDEPREFDFKDKGRPGLHDMDEAMQAQFVSHKLVGKKASKLGGKLGKEWHNLLDDNQDKDENELKEANNLGGKIKKMHNLLGDKENSDPKFEDLENEITESAQPKSKLEQIIENIKAARKAAKLNEAEAPAEEKDELTDKDLEVGAESAADAPIEDDELDVEEPQEEVEKVEITEFIITVDNVDSALDELQELGVTAERVPVEPKEEEVPAPVDEPVEEPVEEPAPAEETPAPEPQVKESMNEADDELDLGTNDELNLGDQGEKTDELNLDGGEETVEPTTEFEENKIKVKAEDWPTLKTWLEEKGVDVAEMFGGEIEMEEVPEGEPEEEINAPVSDEDVDFTGVGDEDKTKVAETPEKE